MASTFKYSNTDLGSSILTESTGGGGDENNYPETLDLNLWLRNYSGAPWDGDDSLGDSGINSAVLNGQVEPTIVSVGGQSAARFDAGKGLSGGNWEDYISAESWSMFILVKVDEKLPNTGTNRIFHVADPEQWLLFVTGYVMDGYVAMVRQWDNVANAYRVVTRPTIKGEWALYQASYGSNTISLRVNSGDWVTLVTTDGVGDLDAGIIEIGDPLTTGGRVYDQSIAEMGISAQTFTEQQFDDILNYVNERYSLSL